MRAMALFFSLSSVWMHNSPAAKRRKHAAQGVSLRVGIAKLPSPEGAKETGLNPDQARNCLSASRRRIKSLDNLFP